MRQFVCSPRRQHINAMHQIIKYWKSQMLTSNSHPLTHIESASLVIVHVFAAVFPVVVVVDVCCSVFPITIDINIYIETCSNMRHEVQNSKNKNEMYSGTSSISIEVHCDRLSFASSVALNFWPVSYSLLRYLTLASISVKAVVSFVFMRSFIIAGSRLHIVIVGSFFGPADKFVSDSLFW